MANPDADRVIREITTSLDQESGLRVYALLDAARNRKIYPAIQENSDIVSRCLYQGEIPQVLAEAAPYLVEFHPGSRFMDWLIREGWGDSWGILLTSSETFKPVWDHCRRFITARDESGKSLYFRFYDPRVFRVYLPTCNHGELKTMFGLVKSFYSEAEDGEALVEYRLSHAEPGMEPDLLVTQLT